MLTKRNNGILCAKEKGYFVDGIGNVWYNGRIVKGFITSPGYRRINIRDYNGECVDVMVHRLQAYQKYGDEMFDESVQVRHLNGDPSDNSWDNIAIGSQSDNMMDRDVGNRLRIAKLAASYVSKRVLAGGIEFDSYCDAARHFGISDNGIRKRIKLNWPGYKLLDA